MKYIYLLIVVLLVLSSILSCKLHGYTSVHSVAKGVVCDTVVIEHHYTTKSND